MPPHLIKRANCGGTYKSRHLGVKNATKTAKSQRIIKISRELMETLKTLHHPWQTSIDKVFTNKYGAPLEADQFRGDYWNRVRMFWGSASAGFTQRDTPALPKW